MSSEKTALQGNWTRRQVLKAMGGAAAAAGLGGLKPIRKALAVKSGRKAIVLGIDGMDPRLLNRFIEQGKMPNAKKLMQMGGGSPLMTSIPPQSPVAWANFITGMNPGGHGIFDFIHREPESFTPHLSTSRTYAAEKSISLGDWVIPTSPGKIKNLRGGEAFWNILEKNGVGCTIFKIPANFPPVESDSETLSGMGTPDILGTYGTFSYYTDSPPENSHDLGGGTVFPVTIRNHKVEAELIGPRNAFRKNQPQSTVGFTAWLDPFNPVAKIEIQGRELLLNQAEWSDWIVVEFEMVPYLEKVSGICRMYMKEVHPHFKLYVSPININPAEPAMPVSTPPDYAKKLVERVGFFYTQGMPEDTKALSTGILDDHEYLEQALFVLKERLRLYEYELNRFDSGFLFFYFSSLDLNSHMFWRTLDKLHPLYHKDLEKEFGWVIPHIYGQMDEVIGKAMALCDDDTLLMVMSDHGFTSFRRGFNLNTWLLNQGYADLLDPLSQEETEFFNNVAWSGTKAYGLGINSLYLNMAGRESEGIVAPGEEANRLVDELTGRLLDVTDPVTGEKVLARVYHPGRVYSGPFTEKAPDLVLGYNRHYRSSWDTILGEYPLEEFVDNDDKWSGDHCMAHVFLPGIFLCNQKFQHRVPALYDLAPSILDAFGVEKPESMVGKSIFG